MAAEGAPAGPGPEERGRRGRSHSLGQGDGSARFGRLRFTSASVTGTSPGVTCLQPPGTPLLGPGAGCTSSGGPAPADDLNQRYAASALLLGRVAFAVMPAPDVYYLLLRPVHPKPASRTPPGHARSFPDSYASGIQELSGDTAGTSASPRWIEQTPCER